MNKYKVITIFLKIFTILLIIGFVIFMIISFKSDSPTNQEDEEETENQDEDLDNLDDNEDDKYELPEEGINGQYFKLEVEPFYCPYFENVIYSSKYNNKEYNFAIGSYNGDYYELHYSTTKKFRNETNCEAIIKLDKKPVLVTKKETVCDDSARTIIGTIIIYTDGNYALINDPNFMCYEKKYQLRKGELKSYGTPFTKTILTMDPYETKKGIAKNLLNSEEELLYHDEYEVYVTDKAIYTKDLIDDSCYKYVNAECKEGLVKNEDLTKIYDDIMFIDRQYIVMKDGTVYSYIPNYLKR